MPIASLRRYLNGERTIKLNVLNAICGVLGLAPDWVIAQATDRLKTR